MSAPVAIAQDPPAYKLIGTLALAGLLSGLGIVSVYKITLPTIEANKAAALESAVFQVVPGAERMERLAWRDGQLVPEPKGKGDAVFAAWDGAGAFLGYGVPAAASGFQDTISLIYGYNPEQGKVLGMRVLDSRETPGLGDKIVKDAHFVAEFDGLVVSPKIELVKGHGEAPTRWTPSPAPPSRRARS